MTKKEKENLKSEYKKFYVTGWDELLIKLKAYGGEMIIPLPESQEHVELLLAFGRIFENSKLKLRRGERRKCHTNAARL